MQSTQYQRWMWTCLSFLTVCRFYITWSSTSSSTEGKYSIKNTGFIRRTVYYLFWTNTAIKFAYLLATYHGITNIHVGFLDQMSIWDWWLCIAECVQETNIWYRKYPLFEVLHVNWTTQERVFKRMGSPSDVDNKILRVCKSVNRMHSAIVMVSCAALVIQFWSAPKYALNTYAVIPFEHPILKVVFAVHEYCFMFHIWIHIACTVVLCETFAVTYTELIQEMGSVMKGLSDLGPVVQQPGGHYGISSSHSHRSGRQNGSSKGNKKSSLGQFIPQRLLNPYQTLPGTEYNVVSLLRDYKEVMLASREFNNWTGKLMGGITGALYGQLVSDVFMMIQLLKESDVDFTGVFFFFMDASTGMLMVFRMLILMAKLCPQSEEFLQSFKTYLQHDMERGERKYLLKVQKTLRVVAAKIGGYSTNPTTVPKGVNALMNYYIGAAMWKRPDASTGRRT